MKNIFEIMCLSMGLSLQTPKASDDLVELPAKWDNIDGFRYDLGNHQGRTWRQI